MENGGYQSFDIIVWFSLLFYHGYIWESIESHTNVSHLTLEKISQKPKVFCTLPSSAWKIQQKTKVDRISGQKGVQDAGECSQVW